MGGQDKTCVKVNEVAVEQRRRRKQGRSNEVDLAMTLALESFLPEDTTQYYYYQVFDRLFYDFFHKLNRSDMPRQKIQFFQHLLFNEIYLFCRAA